MRLYSVLVTLGFSAVALCAQDLSGEAWQLEGKGEALQARERLQRAAESSPGNAAALRAYAEFLDRHRNPEARDVYEKLAQVLARNGGSPAERAQVARRLAVIALLQGDRERAVKHLQDFRAAGGTGLALAATAPEPAKVVYVEIPGPLRSFARMTALSPDLKPDELLPGLARNVVTHGYQAVSANEALEQTE